MVQTFFSPLGNDYSHGNIPGQVMFESGTANTYTISLRKGYYECILVAGGGGGSSNPGGAGAYFNAKVWLNGNYTIVIGSGGGGGASYCRNNSGAGGNNSTLSGPNVNIACPGGRRGCARRDGCGAGITYAPTYSISNTYFIREVSTEETRQNAWINSYGKGGDTCTCDTCAGFAGNSGYCKLTYVGIY